MEFASCHGHFNQLPWESQTAAIEFSTQLSWVFVPILSIYNQLVTTSSITSFIDYQPARHKFTASSI